MHEYPVTLRVQASHTAPRDAQPLLKSYIRYARMPRAELGCGYVSAHHQIDMLLLNRAHVVSSSELCTSCMFVTPRSTDCTDRGEKVRLRHVTSSVCLRQRGAVEAHNMLS